MIYLQDAAPTSDNLHSGCERQALTAVFWDNSIKMVMMQQKLVIFRPVCHLIFFKVEYQILLENEVTKG